MRNIDFVRSIAQAGTLTIATLVLALCASVAACGGGEDPAGPTPTGPDAGSAGAPSPSAPSSQPPASDPGSAPVNAITASLKSGDYFEFLATSASSVASPAGTSTSDDHGTFRLTVGAPATVGGVDGFAVTASGKTRVGGHEFAPSWTFVAQVGSRWLGSRDGATLETLYDPELPLGTTGFFLDTPGSRRIAARPDTFAGEYNRYSALALGDSSSDGGCELVLSYTICSDSETSFSQREYLKDGIGPVGFSSRIGYSAGGNAPSVINASLDLELIATSLAARDGSTVNAPPWKQAAPMPVSRSGATAAAVGGRIYVFGGLSDSPGFTPQRVDVFDTTTGVWSRRPDAPRSLSNWRSVAIGDRIAVLNGPDGLLHDPGTGDWTPMARLAGSGTLAGVGAWTHADGTADIVAILDPGVAYLEGTLHRYSVAANTWSSSGTFEKGQRANYTAVLAGDTLFLLGGYANGRYISSSLAVDLATLESKSIAGPAASAVVDAAAAVVAGQLVVAGGYNAAGASRAVHVIDPQTATVSTGPAMLGGVHNAAVAVVDGRMYVLGGTSGGGATDEVVVLAP